MISKHCVVLYYIFIVWEKKKKRLVQIKIHIGQIKILLALILTTHPRLQLYFIASFWIVLCYCVLCLVFFNHISELQKQILKMNFLFIGMIFFHTWIHSFFAIFHNILHNFYYFRNTYFWSLLFFKVFHVLHFIFSDFFF